ncbi:MAG: class I tRNA ligase family protein, partial [Acidobacteria bacterium]|nr:class I tRNA ligase family protein [Acidobacteriota bacterium]
MTAEAGAYVGLDRFEARKKVVEDLEALGLLVKVDTHQLAIGKCQRCKTVVEPLVSLQWFASMKPLAEPAIKAVEEGRIEFIPENWSKTYFEWMYNIRDWCVSRQLWWGHRIPAWHCDGCAKVNVAVEAPEKCSHCGCSELTQDTDVLDTWFSSALWPFSTLGWPDQTPDLAAYYPTALLITGFDILFFWVARMIMMGIECTGDIPFRQVYIHGLVRDADRQKMSKTKGNTVDPLEITNKYGTDAIRMSLLLGAAPGTDIVLSEGRMDSSRAFANKIWNAARFIFMNMERSGVEPWLPEQTEEFSIPEPASASLEVALEDRWIFSRLNRCADEVNHAVESYRYHEVAQVLWRFVWHEFCDWYVELKKLRFKEGSGLNADWRNMLTVFEAMLRLLHPVMPFLTEELWQRLKAGREDLPSSISLMHYPRYNSSVAFNRSEREMGVLQDIIAAARTMRADLKLDPKLTLDAVLYAHELAVEVARDQMEAIQKLGNLRVDLHEGSAPKLPGLRRSTNEFDLILKIPPTQIEVLAKRLGKELDQLEKVMANSRRQLEDESFVARAPEQVVASIRQKLAEYEAQATKTREALEGLG